MASANKHSVGGVSTAFHASVFERLSAIDVSSMAAKKGNFYYLPWSVAVREVSKLYPDFTWEFTSWDGQPFVASVTGFYVECAVTIEGITRKQMMPVLDYRNNAMMEPTSMDINKAQQRALTKAIALHGLGLTLWAGEDMDDAIVEQKQEQQAKAEIEKIEQWKKDKVSMLKEYEQLTSPKAVATLHTEHVRKASKLGDKQFIKEVTEIKNARIKELTDA